VAAVRAAKGAVDRLAAGTIVASDAAGKTR